MYDIYKLQFGLHPLAAVGKIVRKQKVNNWVHGEETIQKQSTRNRKQNVQNEKTDIKRITKNHKRITYNQT
jgi:hypothetical protein